MKAMIQPLPMLRLVGGTACGRAPRHYEDIAGGLRDLDKAAANGSIVGVCYVAIGVDGNVRVGALGTARYDQARAYLGAARLADALLWEQ